MPYSRKEIEELFSTDEDGRYRHLVLPSDEFGNRVSLIGKKPLELSLDEIVRAKKYAGALYEELYGE